MPPHDFGVVITVSARSVVICRRHHRPDGSISYECARNADELSIQPPEARRIWYDSLRVQNNIDS